MTTPPYGPGPASGAGNRSTGSRSTGSRASGTGPGTNGNGSRQQRTTNRSYHFHVGGNGSGSRNGGRHGGVGDAGTGFFRDQGRGRGGVHSPLADPEFFSNVDIRNYCENGRGLFLQLSFELASASEVLEAVLKEVPDPEGKAFGSRARARRVAKRMKKAAEDTRDTAKNLAATYAAFQREFDPELAPYRGRQRPGRRFDFNG
ncbi:plasmid transfer protein TraA [Streptomyces nondiastaticus]|uniref:Plasmid transfer protein TraA n=1 Tax=Streptomyces nondiastaticus TaxID=3154512 RepID=A0ABW6U5C4_9ACTN